MHGVVPMRKNGFSAKAHGCRDMEDASRRALACTNGYGRQAPRPRQPLTSISFPLDVVCFILGNRSVRPTLNTRKWYVTNILCSLYFTHYFHCCTSWATLKTTLLQKTMPKVINSFVLLSPLRHNTLTPIAMRHSFHAFASFAAVET